MRMPAALLLLCSCSPAADTTTSQWTSGSRIQVRHATVLTMAADGSAMQEEVRYLFDSKLGFECSFRAPEYQSQRYCLPLRETQAPSPNAVYLDSSCAGQPYLSRPDFDAGPAWTWTLPISGDPQCVLTHSCPLVSMLGKSTTAPSQVYSVNGRECNASGPTKGTLQAVAVPLRAADLVAATSVRMDH